jgi:exodeoxyribonuclease-5
MKRKAGYLVMSNVEYTEEQISVIKNILNDIKKSKVVSLGGYAGTGKTTIIKELLKKLPNFKVCAFTGKATNILRRKQIYDAETIHSTIYDVEINENNNITYNLKKPRSLNASGFIIDEASMISEELFDHLNSFKKPIIFVGDHGQLPPIGNTKFNIMSNPNYKLETIHRNAGIIAHFADHLRQGKSALDFKPYNDDVRILKKQDAILSDLICAEQIICAYNKTRIFLNTKIRSYLKLPDHPFTGDKVIVLKNNKTFGVFNGQQGVIKNIYQNKTQSCVDLQFDGWYAKNIPYATDVFNLEKLPQDLLDYYQNQAIIMDYAYAITCHKAQGDQFESIAVFEEPSSLWEQNRWNYTAASRAESKITWYK